MVTEPVVPRGLFNHSWADCKSLSYYRLPYLCLRNRWELGCLKGFTCPESPSQSEGDHENPTVFLQKATWWAITKMPEACLWDQHQEDVRNGWLMTSVMQPLVWHTCLLYFSGNRIIFNQIPLFFSVDLFI